jgi:hypothetical protein
MMIWMAPSNFEYPDLHRHRKLGQHPNPETASLATAFCARIASYLQISPPPIFWFEEAPVAEASAIWKGSTCWGRGSHEDPLRQPECEYFRWIGSRGTTFCGYTHHESPLGIMLNARCVGRSLLETVAEECFHEYQDLSHGPGWRKANAELAERDAKEFVRIEADEIRSFLARSERSE